MDTTKEKAIQAAMAKLTDKEKELLGLVKKEKKPRQKKNYKLKVFYMIGDANGHTDTEATLSLNNPFVHIVTDALDKLKVPKGSWGLVLNDEAYYENYKKKNISKLEHDLLCLVSGYSYDEDTANNFFKEHKFENTEENHNFLCEFEGLFIEEASYSFLVYEDYTLK